ncbi:MAG: hypothetical protein ACYS21_21165 [Planctomycetota bacterium]|jgi:hypothetical protein
MKVLLQLLLFVALLLMCGCSDDKSEPPVEVTFRTGPIKSLSLPAGFQIQNQTLRPRTILAHCKDGRSFSLQAIVPGDDNFDNIGNLPQAYSAMRDIAKKFTVNDREWVLISRPLHGIIAYSLEDDMRLYLIAAGKWTDKAAGRLIEGIKTRD